MLESYNKLRAKYADKITHYLVAYFITSVLVNFTPVGYAALATMVLLASWELIQWKDNSISEHGYDMLANLLGVITVYAISALA